VQEKNTPSWLKSLIVKIVKLRLGHEAVMVDDAKKVLAEGRRLTRRHNDTLLFDDTDKTNEEDSLIDLSETHVYNQPPKGSSKTMPLVLAGAALGASVLGLPLVGAYIANKIPKAVKTAVEKPAPKVEDKDTNTKYRLRIVEE